ncbi:MAG: hypothetical protein AAFQ79_15660 [Pseudomonadota bacterium]
MSKATVLWGAVTATCLGVATFAMASESIGDAPKMELPATAAKAPMPRPYQVIRPMPRPAQDRAMIRPQPRDNRFAGILLEF